MGETPQKLEFIEMFGLKTLTQMPKDTSIFHSLNLEELTGTPGKEAILEANDRARAAYEAAMRAQGKNSWVMHLKSENEQ